MRASHLLTKNVVNRADYHRQLVQLKRTRRGLVRVSFSLFLDQQRYPGELLLDDVIFRNTGRCCDIHCVKVSIGRQTIVENVLFVRVYSTKLFDAIEIVTAVLAETSVT